MNTTTPSDRHAELTRLRAAHDDTLDTGEKTWLAAKIAQLEGVADATEVPSKGAGGGNGTPAAEEAAASPEIVVDPDHRCDVDHLCAEGGEHLCAEDYGGAPASPTAECTEAVRDPIESPIATEAARDHGNAPAAPKKRR